MKTLKDVPDFLKQDLNEIASLVCALYRIDLSNLVSPHRYGWMIEPRQVFCYLARKFTKSTWQDMGLYLGRHQGTPLNHAKRVEDLMALYPEFKERVDRLEKIVSGHFTRS